MFYSSAPPRAGGAVGPGPRHLQAAPSPATGHTWCPLPSLPVPWVSPRKLSFLVPRHWQLLWGSLILGPIFPIPRTSATPTHLRLLPLLQHLFKCFSYPSPSTTRQNSQKIKKYSQKTPSNPEKIRAEIPSSTLCPFHFFSCPFYSSFTAVRAYYQHLQLPFTKDLWVFPCLLPLLYLLTYSII